jgi:hypothetical protein
VYILLCLFCVFAFLFDHDLGHKIWVCCGDGMGWDGAVFSDSWFLYVFCFLVYRAVHHILIKLPLPIHLTFLFIPMQADLYIGYGPSFA